MAYVFGRAFNADRSKLANGVSHDAGVRRHRNVFDLATNGGGGTTNTPLVARVREGNCADHFRLTSDVNLSGLTFTLGTAADPAKYAAAFAGPAAGATVAPPIKPAALAADALTVPEEIILTPSAALPGAGTMIASFYTSKR